MNDATHSLRKGRKLTIHLNFFRGVVIPTRARIYWSYFFACLIGSAESVDIDHAVDERSVVSLEGDQSSKPKPQPQTRNYNLVNVAPDVSRIPSLHIKSDLSFSLAQGSFKCCHNQGHRQSPRSTPTSSTDSSSSSVGTLEVRAQFHLHLSFVC